MTWPIKKLGEVIEINYGKGLPKENRIDSGKYFAYGSNGPVYGTDKSLTKSETIVIGRKGTAGALYFISDPCWPIDTTFFAKPKSDVSLKFIYYLLRTKRLPRLAIVTGVPGINRTTLANINVQLPPLTTQKQIVERLDKITEAQKLNDGLIKKTDELFQSLLHKELNPASKDWGVKKLSEIGNIVTGTTPSTQNADYWNGEFLWATPTDIKKDTFMLTDTPKKLSREGYEKTRPVPKNAILVTCIASIGKMAIAGSEMATNQQINSIVCNENSDPLFVFFSLQKDKKKLISLGKTTAVPIINKSEFSRVKIFLPPLKIQKQIVAKLSAVQNYKTRLLGQKAKLKELFDSALAESMN